MVNRMDALSSFTFLADNLPTWSSQITDLLEHTSQKHAEFAAEYCRLVKHVRAKKIKSPSLISHRSSESRSPDDKDRSPDTEVTMELNPFEAGNRVLFANSKKIQRNTGASIRSGASGPRRFRQKHAVIIYYDSHVQSSLETMVKNISTARNNLRKGKKARSLKRGPILPSLGHFDSYVPDFKRGTSDINPKPNNDANPGRPTSNIDSCFTVADKELEQAQNLCETAAHQFLRDGDTAVELKTVQEKMDRVLGFARETVGLLQEEEQANKRLESAETPNTTPEELDQFKFDFPSIPSEKAYVPKSDPMAAIEVDSDDGAVESYPEVFAKGFSVNRYRSTGTPNFLRT